MSDRRLIGLDLAWKEGNGTGCVELKWDGDELALSCVKLCSSVKEIVEWIDQERGDWVVAVDAPLVVENETGQREADSVATKRYGRCGAGAYPANKGLLGEDHPGGKLLRKLKSRNTTLVEAAEHLNSGRLVFETYPHIVMVELFGHTFKYKKGLVAKRRAGQQELADAIRTHLCGEAAAPRLQIDDVLDELLCEPASILKGRELKKREDKLDAVICAYTAAWVDAGRPLQGLGEVGSGVMITPSLRGICPPFG